MGNRSRKKASVELGVGVEKIKHQSLSREMESKNKITMSSELRVGVEKNNFGSRCLESELKKHTTPHPTIQIYDQRFELPVTS